MIYKQKIHLWPLAGLIFAAQVESFAQTAPDAGTILRQIERSFPPPTLPEVGPPVPVPSAEMPKGAGKTIVVSRFEFEGAEAVSAEELSVALRGYLGRPLTLEELRNAAAQVALAYRAKGLLASASIARQEVKGGVVKVAVAESRFGMAELDPSSDGRTKAGLLERIVRQNVASGQIVNTYDVDRALLLMNDLPGASVQGALRAGKFKGTTDLVLVSSARPLVVGSVLADNAGARSTGEARAVFNATVDQPRGDGEQFAADLLHTDGSDYGRLGYSMPAPWSGSRLSFSASAMSYQLVSSDYVSAAVSGTSSTLSADLTLPLLRSRSANLYASCGLTGRWFANRAAGSVTSDYVSQTLEFGLNGNLYDGFAGGGVSTGSLSVNIGRVDLAGSPNFAADQGGPRVDGWFGKLSLGLGRTQQVGRDYSLALNVRGQAAFHNLDSSEKFFLGGNNGLRAYPTSEGGGDLGMLSSLELRTNLTPRTQGTLFLDQGWVAQNYDPDYAGGPTDNGLTYRGWGLGLSQRFDSGVKLSLQWSRRIGDNPRPSSSGTDQDGSLRIDRFWASASFNF